MHESLKLDQVYVTVDILILSMRNGKLCLMLSRRTDPPYEGRLALPGRFIGLEESAEKAVQKLMNEMLPVPDVYSEQLYTFTDVSRDPRGRVISLAYLAIIPQQRLEETIAGGESRMQPYGISLFQDQLQLTGPDGETLSGNDLAFDHGRIIRTGIRRLQGKIDYTDIGFRFINDLSAFSLSELQTVFEMVLDTQLDKSNFRRTILTRYEKSGRLRQTKQDGKGGRGRPAALYQFDI